MKKTVRKEQEKDEEQEQEKEQEQEQEKKKEGKVTGKKEIHAKKQVVVESKGAGKKAELETEKIKVAGKEEIQGAKKMADLGTKPATNVAAKKKERSKSDNDNSKVSPTKARTTSQSRWKTVNNNLPAKVNKKVDDTKEGKDDKDKASVRPTPKTRSISTNRRRASPEKKKPVEKVKLEVQGKKLQTPPAPSDSNKQKMDLLFAAHCNWGTEEETGEDKGISAYQLTRWLKNVNLLRPKVNELTK